MAIKAKKSSKVRDVCVFPGASEEGLYSDWDERSKTLLVRIEALTKAVLNGEEWTAMEMALRIANQASCVIDHQLYGEVRHLFVWEE